MQIYQNAVFVHSSASSLLVAVALPVPLSVCVLQMFGYAVLLNRSGKKKAAQQHYWNQCSVNFYIKFYKPRNHRLG